MSYLKINKPKNILRPAIQYLNEIWPVSKKVWPPLIYIVSKFWADLLKRTHFANKCVSQSYLTLSNVQWAAVSICQWVIRDPPHMWFQVLFSKIPIEAIQGHLKSIVDAYLKKKIGLEIKWQYKTRISSVQPQALQEEANVFSNPRKPNTIQNAVTKQNFNSLLLRPCISSFFR